MQMVLSHAKSLAMSSELDASGKPPIQGRFGSYPYGLLMGERHPSAMWLRAVAITCNPAHSHACTELIGAPGS